MNKHVSSQEISRYELHPFCRMFPEIDTEMGNILTTDISKHGQRHAIKLFQGKILDGRARYVACIRLSIMPKFEEFMGTEREALDFVFSENMARRHLEVGQRALVAARMAVLEDGENARYRNLPTQAEAAALMNISTGSLKYARIVLQKGIDELVRAVELGDIPIQPASEIAQMDQSIQKEIMSAKDPKKALAEWKNKPVQQLRAKLRTLWDNSGELKTTWDGIDGDSAKWFVNQVLNVDCK